ASVSRMATAASATRAGWARNAATPSQPRTASASHSAVANSAIRMNSGLVILPVFTVGAVPQPSSRPRAERLQPRQHDVAAVDEPPVDDIVVGEAERGEHRVGQVDARPVHGGAVGAAAVLGGRALV